MKQHSSDPRGIVAVVMVALLVIIDLIVVSLVLTTGREHLLTVSRLETVEAFYAAEAGVNMSVRELVENADEDLDGTIGTISDDSDVNTDPALGNARFVVFATADTPSVGVTTMTSQGRAGEARREMRAVIE